jgi:23S rRNA-/tRNA-specific pseudouridylate synthase
MQLVPLRFGNRSVDSLLPALTFDAPEPPRFVHRLDRDTSGGGAVHVHESR